MEQTIANKTYRSPGYKLLQFFNRSRDRWKTKCLAGKVRIKRLENRVVGLEVSREKWKAKAQAQRAQIAQLRQELEQVKNGST